MLRERHKDHHGPGIQAVAATPAEIAALDRLGKDATDAVESPPPIRIVRSKRFEMPSLTPEDAAVRLELIDHANFSIWYDAGNIIYYTGADPVAELKGLAPHVTGFCAKDCANQKTPVMIQFGKGRVDFKAVFDTLKKAGFKGPVMIECTGEPNSPEHGQQLAQQNRDVLKKALGSR